MDGKLQNLLFNAKQGQSHQSKNIVQAYLADPSGVAWPEDVEELDRFYKKIYPYLNDHRRHLLQLSILSSCLLSTHKTLDNKKEWLGITLDLDYIFSGISLDNAFDYKWKFVPLLSVGEGGNRINYCIIGSGDKGEKTSDSAIVWPEWFGVCMDNKAKQAVYDAFETAARTSGRSSDWYLLGLLPPIPKIIQDRSLAFPLALTARSLLENRSLCPGCIATGDLELKQGSVVVGRVGGVSPKWQEAKENHYSLLLYPNANALENTLPDEMKSIAVADFETGWMWATLYSPCYVNELKSLEAALQGPNFFVAMCDTLDVNSLNWCSKSRLIQAYLKEIRKDIELIQSLGEKLKKCYARSMGNYSQTAAMASLFNTPDDINMIAEIDPVTALLWCSVYLGLANHDGDLEGAANWIELGMKYKDRALTRLNGRRIFNQFINRWSGVMQRHNRYDFRSSLPDEFMAVLECQIKINKLNGTPSDYGIGSMCGTVAQNYAFCGPDFIDLTRAYFSRAQIAFGVGKEPLLRDDWRRQFFYLFFALLDCGSSFHEEARAVLCRYLEIETWNEIQDPFFSIDDKTNPFPLFALVRGLVDMPDGFAIDDLERLSGKVLSFADSMKVEFFIGKKAQIHPWQLFIYNAGRLALNMDDLQLAYRTFEKSILLCQYGEDTINAMALLPLSQMFKIGQLNQELKETCMNVLDDIRMSSNFNPEHFRKLIDVNDVEQTLTLVVECPELFFPFNYR